MSLGQSKVKGRWPKTRRVGSGAEAGYGESALYPETVSPGKVVPGTTIRFMYLKCTGQNNLQEEPVAN